MKRTISRHPPGRSRRVHWYGWAVAILVSATPAAAQSQALVTLETGKQIYDTGCATCHGRDGKGQSQHRLGFEPPASFPDFSDCATSTPETDVQWRAVISHGGAARAFSPIMPAFENVLRPEQINQVIEYVRGLCADRAWPRGELNFPRAFLTEKAFPEDELVFSSWRITQAREATNALEDQLGQAVVHYEHRLGASSQIEASIPYQFTQDVGAFKVAASQLAIGYKQVVFQSSEKGSIVSGGIELLGSRASREFFRCGITNALEPFVAYGQRLPGDSFVQLNVGGEFPFNLEARYRGYYVRSVIGKTIATGDGLGRRWSPMIEVLSERYPASGSPTAWDVIPQLQIPLSKRLHILGNVGYQVPVSAGASTRASRFMFSILWDWVDGGPLQGW